MKALVVIDVQQGMFSLPDLRPFDGEGVVARLAVLVAKARETGLPIFFVQHAGREPEHPLAPDGSGFDIRSELAPAAGDTVVVKRHCGAFHDTDLDGQLGAQGITHLIVGGMQSEFCVDTAVRSAAERGYSVTLVADCHTTFDTPALQAE